MAIIDHGESEIQRIWSLVTELSDQLNQNRAVSVALISEAIQVKAETIHSQTGYVLRRYNLDKTQEEYDEELERMNHEILGESQRLVNDNKQLNSLIKEYEQTLDTVMSNFRNRAQDVQERELSLIRDYESKLLALEEENVTQELSTTVAVSESFARLSRILRNLLHSLGGEDISEEVPLLDSPPKDTALESEIELARLERENDELRRMLGLLPPAAPRRPDDEERVMFGGGNELQRFPLHRDSSQSRIAIGAGTIGPKRSRLG